MFTIVHTAKPAKVIYCVEATLWEDGSYVYKLELDARVTSKAAALLIATVLVGKAAEDNPDTTDMNFAYYIESARTGNLLRPNDAESVVFE
jgi:hypothetical protein